MRQKVVAARSFDLRRWTIALSVLALGAAAIVFCQAAFAQDSEPAPLTEAELEELVGPIALYPDDLLGIVLPASTYPLQIVQAARFLEDRESDPSLEPSDEWDSSIVALLNYPEVVGMMDEDLDWTWALGEAVLDNQADVIDAVQTFRDRAYAAGNLRSDDRQVVTEDDGVIEIAPANPEVVYIPYYEPERVVIYQPAPAYYYYPHPYPLYYYPYPIGYSFSSPFFWGVTSWFAIGWHTHFLHVHHHTHFGHPYYLNRYYAYTPYYWRSGVNISINVDRVAHVWAPNYRGGVRPYRGGPRYRIDDGRRVRTVYEGGRTTAGGDATRQRSATRTESREATRLGNGTARALREDASTARRSAAPQQRTIGGVAGRGSAPSSTTPRAQTQNRGNGSSSAQRGSGDATAAPRERTAAGGAATSRAPTAPRTVAPQRTIGGVAAGRSAAPSNTPARAVAPQRSGSTSRFAAVQPGNVPQQRSMRVVPQRSESTARVAAPQRSAPAQRSSAPQQRGATQSSGSSRDGGARQATRR